MSEYKFLRDQEVYPVSSKGTDPETGIERFTQNLEIRRIEDVETDILRSTDGLVGALDGTLDSESKHYFSGIRQHEGPVDAAIYLDKSSRPVRMLVHEVWSDLSEGHEPSASFLNIDKEDYMLEMGIAHADYKDRYYDPQQLGIDRLSEQFIKIRSAEIRALYFEHTADIKKAERLIEDARTGSGSTEALDSLWSVPTKLDGKHVAVIDEVRSSGATLHIADQLLQNAFPDANLEPLYWSTPVTHRYSAIDPRTGEEIEKLADTEKPQWYDSSTSAGRGGIEGKSEALSSQSENVRTRVGRFVLSVPYRWLNEESDTRGGDLRRDIKLLAERLRQKKITFIPSRDRENVVEKFEKFNTMTFAQWAAERRKSSVR